MMLARVCRTGISPTVASLIKTPVSPNKALKIQPSRLFANDGRTTFTRTARKNPTVMEKLQQPATETPFVLGKAVVAGASAFGLGCLCYYGLGLSSGTGAIDQVHFWPEYVKERIKSTYAYFGGSVILTAASTAMCLRSPMIMNLVARQGWLAIFGIMAAMIGSGMVAQSIPYSEGIGPKQLAWMVHTGIIGAVIAPMCLLGGPLVMRAALYTAGVVGGLSTVAVCAPSEKFLQMAGPLSIGLGVVFVSSLGSMFLPPTTAMGAGLYSISLYGGLVLFSMFLLYDTQRIMKQAQLHPKYTDGITKPYDPVNNAISIYLDTLNIFVRILTILAGGGSNRRK
ncbi:hypothetical protein KPH14_002955 [Odynerus spinipes]|uniref:Growth hormone-inducible transmembrane protein n=1 Tax=Odynerus spinipes TaxID=1348599 RepID=A0AAD9RX13_9HYME|nr:hypothetical protein KPH14_002955 [Odynerus spinipes]